MISRIAEKLELKFTPVAIIFADEKPEGARQFKEGAWGCTMFMLAAAVKGETAVFDRHTFGCHGGGVGLGFGDQYENFAGGKECFKYFLSTGNEQWEEGRKTGEKLKEYMRGETHDHFLHGEGYFKSPDRVQKFIDSLPITDVESTYVVFKPLAEADEHEDNIQVVVFLADMDQIAALTILASYGRGYNENVIVPYAAGCQTLGIYPFREAQREQPRAVLGLTDLSARVYLKRMIKEDVMSFAMPLSLFREMEENLSGSFLDKKIWQQLLDMRS